MDYVCENMKRIVIYEKDTISVTLERCDGCIGCLRSKAEDISRILAQPGFEKAKIIIERMRDK